VCRPQQSLWGDDRAQLQMATYDQTAGEVETLMECAERVRVGCQQCSRENSASCPTLFTNDEKVEACEWLIFDIVDGPLKYCFTQMLKRPSLKLCFEGGGNTDLCGAPEPTATLTTVHDLRDTYEAFNNSSLKAVCVAILESCESGHYDVEIDREKDLSEVVWEPGSCEQKWWSWCLNDTGCNDKSAALCGYDRIWWDPMRPEGRDTLCEDYQPTDYCSSGNQPSSRTP